MFRLHVLKISQANVDLYITVMNASDLWKFSKVDSWSESYNGGYQRPLHQNRINKAARYLLDEDGLFPTSILVNIRGEVNYYPSNKISSIAEFGILEVPDSSLPFWIIDGQHRLAALFAASRENEKFDNYAVPVSIFNFAFRYDEMRQFYIVNDRQKRIKTDLAQRHLFSTLSKEGESKLLEFEPKDKILTAESTRVVDFLRLHPDSPWHYMIQIPSQSKRGDNISTQTSMAKSIGYILRTFSPEQRKKIMEEPKVLGLHLINYWNALKEICPEAFRSPKDYKLQKTFGCYVFHMIFPYIYERCEEYDDFSVDFMKETLLEMLIDFGERNDADATVSAFWHSRDGHYLTRGSGMKVIRHLAKQFMEFF